MTTVNNYCPRVATGTPVAGDVMIEKIVIYTAKSQGTSLDSVLGGLRGQEDFTLLDYENPIQLTLIQKE